MTPHHFIGLMSGTSLDGVDGVLVAFDADPGVHALRVVSHQAAAFPASLREHLLALNTSGPDELHRAALAGNALTRIYADVVHALLRDSGCAAHDVVAVGAHGQTVRHQPGAHDGVGYTWQLNQPALLAEWCGIDVVADFRRRDLAAGGQGAPLVPLFHHHVFGQRGTCVAVLNLGGIANLSVLHGHPDAPDQAVMGFDCGPANVLIDHWCHHHTGQPFDDQGAWAATGQVNTALLARLRHDPFFALPPPKSTGRDLFHPAWLNAHLRAFPAVSAPDVQATLTALTVHTCAADVRQHASQARTLLVCGGGALNTHLMQQLALALPGVDVCSSATHGLPPLQVEASAFAWLARQCVLRAPGNAPRVTGARGPRVLGAVYPR